MLSSKEKDVKEMTNKNKFKKNGSELDLKIEKLKKTIESDLEKTNSDGEIEELVGSDGTMMDSSVPFLNMTLHPRKTTDQTIPMARVSNDPVTRGYRVYWGESIDKDENLVNEIDYSDAFGYDETKDKDWNGTVKTLKKMGVENPIERAEQFGKLKKQKVKKTKTGKKVLKQRLVEKKPIEEIQRQKMLKMVEDILVNKKKETELGEKDTKITKNVLAQIQTLKNVAKKEGIELKDLIKFLKKNEQ